MSGYNTAAFRTWMLQSAFGGFAAGASAHWPDAMILGALTRAEAVIQADRKLLREVDETVDVVAGTAAYSPPSNLLGRAMYDIFWLNSNGGYSLLDRVGYTASVDTGMLDADAVAGDPLRWAWDESQLKVVLIPTPATSQTAGLLVHLAARPSPLERIFTSWEASTPPLANVTLGSDEVAIVDADAVDIDLTGSVAAGDEFGLAGSTSVGGTTSLATPPVRWYTVLSVASGLLTLSEDYAGVTDTAQPFLCGQVPAIEQAHPGKVMLMPAKLALGELLNHAEAEQAAAWRSEGMAEMRNFRVDEQNLKLRGRRQRAVGSWFNN